MRITCSRFDSLPALRRRSIEPWCTTATPAAAVLPDALAAPVRIDPNLLLGVRQLAGAAAQIDRALVHDRHPGRVVAAILEPPQPLNQNGNDFLRADVSNNPAHSFQFSVLSS